MKYWKAVVLTLVLLIVFTFVVSCGGAGGSAGGFIYGVKYTGSWGTNDTGTYRSSDFYILLDAEGNIVSTQSYASQGARCSIAGSVRKNGAFLSLIVQLSVDQGNASCTNITLSASDQLSFDAGSRWWMSDGNGTGTFSDNPNSVRRVGFSLARGDY